VVGLLLMAGLAGVVMRKLGRRRARADRAATYMGRDRNVEGIDRESAAATAQRLGVTGSASVPIGRAVSSGQAAASVTYGRGHRTVSHHLHRERILDVADLAAVPEGRAVVVASGARPTLIRTQPWTGGPHDAAVRTSVAAHDPQADRTLREAEAGVPAAAAAEAQAVTPRPIRWGSGTTSTKP
jgi:hypothetical protein